MIKEIPEYGPAPSDGEIVIAKLLGEPTPRQKLRVRYQNTSTGEIYLCLSGGFAWPIASQSASETVIEPGFAVAVAVMEDPDDNGKVIYKVLAEAESQGATELIRKAHRLFLTYGSQCRILPWSWIGDPDDENKRFLRAFNHNSKRDDSKEFFLYPPPTIPNLQVYRELIRSLTATGNKRLFLGEKSNIRNCLLNNTSQQAITALGSILDYFETIIPWLRDLSPQSEDDDIDEDEWW